MDSQHPYKNKINSDILSESLKDTFERVIPYYNEKIEPLIFSKKNILIVFHGNSCRALLMKILNISKEKITELEIPTGNPLLIRFSDNLKVQNYKYLDTTRAKKILPKPRIYPRNCVYRRLEQRSFKSRVASGI